MMAHKLPIYLPSPARKPPSQEFDYRELLVDKMFHAMIEKERRKGFFDGVAEGTPDFNSKLKKVALAFVRETNEERATLFRNRGIMYGREYEAYREAISCYNRAMEMSHASPSRHLTLANRAAAYMKSQKYADALVDAQEAAKLAPNYAIAHSLAGYCQSQLGLVKEAIVNYKRALRINPRDECSEGLLEDAKRELISSGESAEDIEALEALSVAVEDGAQETSLELCVDLSRATHRRYLNSEGRASSIQEMMRKASLYDKSELEDLMVSVANLRPPGEETPRRVRLVQKLSSRKASPFVSIVKLPKKLKIALAKKSRKHSDPEPSRVSGDREDLNSNALEETAEPSDQFPPAKSDGEGSAGKPPGPSRRAHVSASKKVPAGGESVMNVRDPAEVVPPAPAASALGAPVSSSPVIRGHDANSFVFSSSAPEERDTWEPPLPAGDSLIVQDNTHFDESLGGVAASPDTVGYNEYQLQGLVPPSTPLFKAQPSQCPDRPARPSGATGHKTHARIKLSTAPAQPELERAVFVSPLPEERMISPCPFNTRLVSVHAPAVVLPTSTRQPSPSAGSQWLTAERFSDQDKLVVPDPPYVHGVQGDICILKAEKVGALGAGKDEELGWRPCEASSEAVNPGREHSGATVIAKIRMEEGTVATSPDAGRVPKQLDESR